MKLKDIMSKNPIKVESNKTVRDAVTIMASKKVGSLLVCKGKEIVGILEERDVIKNVLAKDLNPYVIKVEEVMSVPFVIDEEKTDNEANDMMSHHQVRHLAVTTNSIISGIVSMQDLIRPVYSGKSFWT